MTDSISMLSIRRRRWLHVLAALGCVAICRPSFAQDTGKGTGKDTAKAGAKPAAKPADTAAEPVSCVHHEPLKAADPLPGLSLYHSKAALTDQQGHALSLGSFRGQPLLVTMFYSSCTSICPMLIAQLKRVEQQLPEALRQKTHILLVSLDPARDTVARLAELATRHEVDGKRWHFTRTSESSVREIAALLGVRYRKLPDGEIGHSPLIALLDRDGSIALRVEGTVNDPAPLAAAVVRAAAPRAPAAKK